MSSTKMHGRQQSSGACCHLFEEKCRVWFWVLSYKANGFARTMLTNNMGPIKKDFKQTVVSNPQLLSMQFFGSEEK